VWGSIFLHRLHGLPIGRADNLFGMILAGTGLTATLLGGVIANRLRRRTESGYAWLMAASITAAVPVCVLAVLAPGTNLALGALGAAMFLLFLPTGPITTEMFEIVPAHLRASAVALCTFFIHLFGDLGSPAVVGSVSQKAHDMMIAAGSAAAAADVENAMGLRDGVLILPVVLAIGALLWGALLVVPARESA
jgi:sugar phosphate permease